MFAVLFVQLFSTTKFGMRLGPTANFKTYPDSLLAVYQMIVGDEWVRTAALGRWVHFISLRTSKICGNEHFHRAQTASSLTRSAIKRPTLARACGNARVEQPVLPRRVHSVFRHICLPLAAVDEDLWL